MSVYLWSFLMMISAVEGVPVRNCYIYSICFCDCLVKHNYIWSVVKGS